MQGSQIWAHMIQSTLMNVLTSMGPKIRERNSGEAHTCANTAWGPFPDHGRGLESKKSV